MSQQLAHASDGRWRSDVLPLAILLRHQEELVGYGADIAGDTLIYSMRTLLCTDSTADAEISTRRMNKSYPVCGCACAPHVLTHLYIHADCDIFIDEPLFSYYLFLVFTLYPKSLSHSRPLPSSTSYLTLYQ